MTIKASLTLILCLQTLVAHAAAAGDAATLSTTRELAKQGLTAYDAGRYDEAVEKLSKAYAVVRLPTLAVATARALVKTGKLIAASEIYLEATRMPREKSWQATQQEAQRDAERERAELLPRIPRLVIAMPGADHTAVTVSIDGVTIPQALNDAEQMVDPGERRVKGVLGEEAVERNVSVKEGERLEVTLAFPRRAHAASASPDEPSQRREATLDHAPPESNAPVRPGQAQRVIGWTGVTLGGVGLVVGAVSGLVASSKRSDLRGSNDCDPVDGVSCRSSRSSDVDTYNSLRTASMVGFIAGGIVAAAGVTLLLTVPKRESQPTIGLWLGPSGASIYGGF